jgi:hypothetical protein
MEMVWETTKEELCKVLRRKKTDLEPQEEKDEMLEDVWHKKAAQACVS